jgi:hypothetical protein
VTSLALKKPVTVADTTVAAVTFRDMTFRDLKLFTKAAEKDELAAMGELLANLTGLTAPQVDALGMDDVADLFKVIKGFLSAFKDEDEDEDSSNSKK